MPFDRLSRRPKSPQRRRIHIEYRTIDFGRHGEIAPGARDGSILPEHPFWTTAPAASAGVPLIVGSTLTEFGIGFLNPEFEKVTIDELRSRVVKGHGPEDGPRFSTRSAGTPDASRRALHLVLVPATRACGRPRRVAQAARRPMYQFAWTALNRRGCTAHCLRCPRSTTRTAAIARPAAVEARSLAARISSAWVQFGRTGNPNHGGLPPWPAFDAEKRSTMVFDDTCAVKDDPDGDELATLAGSMRWT
jgi:para-nitrobenzyl esterase